MAEDVQRDEVEALLATRRELGPEYETALVESFTARVEQAVAARAQEVERAGQSSAQDLQGGRVRQFVLGVVSLGVGVPVTVVPLAATDGSLVALPVVALGWLGIIGVNAAHALALRPGRRSARP